MVTRRIGKTSVERLLRFSQTIGKLKLVKRTGWISQVGIDEPESVADHSFRCAMLGMCIGDLLDLETEKLVRMLLLHDIQEALTGDFDYDAKKDKGIRRVRCQQRTAIKDILSWLPARLKDQYLLLWEEYEHQTTPEAILAHDIDKIEMLAQALEYERQGYDRQRLGTFWNEAKGQIETPTIQNMLKLLADKRTANE
jgi:putative hydrolase of HD superfamily